MSTLSRFFMQTAPTHALSGGSLFLGYQLFFDTLRHHDEANLRPKFIDHTIAMSLIGVVGTALTVGLAPRYLVGSAIFFGFTIGPMIWWFKLNGSFRGGQALPSNVFYEDDATPEDIARYQAQDQTEQLAHLMSTRPAYGMFQRDQRYI